MATAGELLVEYSSLPGTATAAAHFLAIEFGEGGTIVRGDCFYKLVYVGQEARAIEYRLPQRQNLSYLEPELIIMSYREKGEIKVSYIENEPIKLEFKC